MTVSFPKFRVAWAKLSTMESLRRRLPTRLREHKADLGHHRLSNELVLHAQHTDPLPDLTKAEVIHKDLTKDTRRAIEAAPITVQGDALNASAGFVRLATPSSNHIMNNIVKRRLKLGIRLTYKYLIQRI